MKSMIVIALALVAVAAALPVEERREVKIVSFDLNQDPEGFYRVAFESEDGTKRSEEGKVKEVLDEENKPHKVVVVRGSYNYINSAGEQETISYTADENGFIAEGASVPQLPARR